MKYLICIITFLLPFISNAQDVKFAFANPEITYHQGNAYFEADVVISTLFGESFKLSSGQIYPNYNAEAFGENIIQNNALEITHPADAYLLGSMDNSNVVRVYSDVILNDNTPSRFSVAWQQSMSGNCIEQTVNTTPILLFHLKIKFLPGAEHISPELCFESSELFVRQTYTVCGTFTGNCNYTPANCTEYPGTQITSDEFDCSETSTSVSTTNPNETISDVRLFPNPVSDEFSVQFESARPDAAQLVIKDLLGRTLHMQSIDIQIGENKFDLNIKQYAIGTYFLEIYTQENVNLAVKKITKT